MGGFFLFVVSFFSILYLYIFLSNKPRNKDDSDVRINATKKQYSTNESIKENIINQSQTETRSSFKPNEYIKVYSSLVPNTRISLEKKVPVSEFISFVKKQEPKNKLLEKKHVYMWDFGVNASKFLKHRDNIWILTGNKLYEAELDFMIKNESGEIGDTIGWSRQFGSAWKNVAVFTNCIKHAQIPEWVHSYSKGDKNSIAKNFYRL